MAVNTTDITTLYNDMFTAMVAKYDIMWSANQIDAETYAQLVGQASSQLVALSAELVQKQEALDADNLIKAKQLEVMEAELDLKRAEADTAYVKMLSSIDKEMGYDYTLDIDGNVNRDSLSDAGDGVIDYEREFKREQQKVMFTERVVKDKEAAKLGLDNVMKLSEAAKDADANFVYTPNYEDGII